MGICFGRLHKSPYNPISSSFGLMLALLGMSHKSYSLSACGLYLLSLKPQLGIIFLTSLFTGGYYKVVACASAVIAASFGASFAFGGFVRNIEGFLSNIPVYSSSCVNQPPELTELIHLLDYANLPNLPTAFLISITVFIGLALGFALRRHQIRLWGNESLISNSNAVEPSVHWVLVAIVVAALFVPFHTYDLVFIAPVAFIATSLKSLKQQLLLFPGLILLLRATNFAEITGFSHPDSFTFIGSLACSIAILMLFVGTLISLLLREERGRSNPT